MPVILKKCFLFHYDPSINSDKVFNLFLIDNENGSFSAISEYVCQLANIIAQTCNHPCFELKLSATLNFGKLKLIANELKLWFLSAFGEPFILT